MPPGDRNWTVDGIMHFVMTNLKHYRHELALQQAGYWLNHNGPSSSDLHDWIKIGSRYQPNRATLWLALYRASELSHTQRPQHIYLDYARACTDYSATKERDIRRIGRVVPWYLLRAFVAEKRRQLQVQLGR